MDSDLERAIRRAQAGDLDAFSELVARFQDFVYGLAYHLSGSFEDAHDLAQETFVRAYQRVGDVHDPTRFPGWLRQVTVSVCLNALPAIRRRRALSLDEASADGLGLTDPAPQPGAAAEAAERRRAVLETVEGLPSEYGLPLSLYYLDGLSFPAVGEFLGLTPGAAKMRVHRARQMVRRELAGMFEDAFAQRRLPEGFPREVREHLERFLREYEPEWVLLNPDALRFERDPDTGDVIALPSGPLQYRSDDLGYTYTVYEKRVRFRARRPLDSERNWQQTEELEPQSEDQRQRWEANRRAHYVGSLPHFLHAWAYGREAEEGFEVLHPPGGPVLRRIAEVRPHHLDGPELQLNQGGLYQIVIPGGELRVRCRAADAIGVLRATDETEAINLQGECSALGGWWGTGGYWEHRAGWSLPFAFLATMHGEERARWTAAGRPIRLRAEEVRLSPE